MNEWLHANWPTLTAFIAGLGAGGGLIKWFLNRELQHLEDRRAADERRFLDHESRLRAMERDLVTKENFDELRESMMASFTSACQGLGTRIEDMRDDLRWVKNYLVDRKS